MSDLRETLEQLDRRLDDLRHKIATLAEEPRAAEARTPAPERPDPAPEPPAPSPEHSASVADPSPEPPPAAPQPWLQSASAEGPSGGDRPKGLDVLFGRAAPPPPDPEPAPAAEEEPSPAEPPPFGSESVDVAAQIQELIDLRDQLLANSRELVRTYEQKLDTLEQMAAAGLPAGAVGPPAPDESPAAVASSGGHPPVIFEGTVKLVVSGAQGVQIVEVLEDSLGRASQVEQVYIRRSVQGQVWLELTLSSGVELVDELGRVLPFRFAVVSAAGSEIALTLEDGP